MGKPMAERCCRWCQELFTPRSGAQNFCSENCRKKAEAWRRPERTRKKAVTPAVPGGRPPTIEQVIAWTIEHKKKTGVYLGYTAALVEMRKEGYNT